MAIIEKIESTGGSVTGWDIAKLCPAGAHVAVCLEVKDTFDVTRPKYDDPSQSEVVNLTRFLFGIKATDGTKYRVQTHDLKISGHEKSALVGFLTTWLAKPLDELFGWDYVEQVGKPAMLTIVHKTSQRGTVYAIIQGISPLLEQLIDQVPPRTEFTGGPIGPGTESVAPTEQPTFMSTTTDGFAEHKDQVEEPPY